MQTGQGLDKTAQTWTLCLSQPAESVDGENVFDALKNPWGRNGKGRVLVTKNSLTAFFRDILLVSSDDSGL